MRILVTGGTGFIGSHTCVELLDRGHEVVILDNLRNSRREVVDAIGDLAGRRPSFIEGDVRDETVVREALADVDAVMHFAALKAVGDSWSQPLDYYDNNVGGSLVLLRAMQAADVRLLVFSSSATVYGEPERCPVTEDAPLRGVNPYGRTKLMMEQVIADAAGAWTELRPALLRYFNPVGAHPSGRLGEDPNGTPTNLMPLVARAAAGRLQRVQVYGDDYPTHDGTGVRDYIHVVDLARAHVDALDYLAAGHGPLTINLGTGCGYSVLEVIRAFERASGRTVPYEIVARRPGDAAACYADPSHAYELLGWRTEFDLDRMCEDSWRWEQRASTDQPVAASRITD